MGWLICPSHGFVNTTPSAMEDASTWTWNYFFQSWNISMGVVTVDFTTHGGSHLYGLPYRSADSLEPMDHFCTFYVPNIIPKNMHYLLYMTFKPILVYICGFDPQTHIHQDVCKRPIVLDFSLMWIWVTCLLAFHMPWDRSNLTFHYPIEALYKEPFGYIERRRIEEQENYSPLLS